MVTAAQQKARRELSIAVGYSDTQISRLEHNERLPDLATLPTRFLPVLGLEKEPQVAARPTVINPISREIWVRLLFVYELD